MAEPLGPSLLDFPGGSVVKNPLPKQEMQVWSMSLERSPRERNGNPIQHSCLGKPMDRGVGWAAVHGVIRVRHIVAVQLLSCIRIFATDEQQLTRLPCPSPSLRVCSNSCPLSQWCHPTMSNSAAPFSSCPQFPQYQGLFQWVGSLHQVAKVLELQHQPFQWIFTINFL